MASVIVHTDIDARVNRSGQRCRSTTARLEDITLTRHGRRVGRHRWVSRPPGVSRSRIRPRACWDIYELQLNDEELARLGLTDW